MAYSNSTGDRMDELRFRSQQSPRSDTSPLSLVSPPRNGTRVAQPMQTQDSRGGLMRRFTTDSGRVPTISSMSSQRGVQQDPQEYGPTTYHKVQLLEKKKIEYERLREQKRRFEAEMQLLDQQQRREEQELAQMQEDIGRANNTTGHQSEPTTPPEYRDSNSGFPSLFSRPNRYSTSSLTSPPGLYNRPARSGSQLISPQSGLMLSSRLMMDDKLPSKSVPGSRRNSDEDEKEEAVRQDPTSHRSTNALNRYSMPVTKSRTGTQEFASFDQTNTTRFLFGDEDSTLSPEINKYLEMNTTDNKFPVLIRHDDYPNMLSASSAALDLATSTNTPQQADTNGWGVAGANAFARHRPSQSQQIHTMNSMISPTTNGSVNGQVSMPESPVRASYRHSLDLSYEQYSEPASMLSSPSKISQATPPKLQSSFSTNDIPTMRSTTNGISGPGTSSNTHAQQHLHNHNASLGRIPNGGVPNNRASREMSSPEVPAREMQNGGYQSMTSVLHASAPSFGPSISQGISQAPQAAISSPTSQAGYPVSYYPAYNSSMQMMAMGMQNMSLGQPMYPQHVTYPGYAPYSAPPPRDSQARVIQQRRQNDGEAMNRFANMALESLGGEIYTLCKDQHGCRYLQKKLEDRNPEHVHMIWLETNPHVTELMTDPFGNYLCQKLLEFCNDEERTVLIENASQDLVRIALNQHGTRALQKMIEFISTPGQVQTIINALRFRVVELIQDLNGNHVIQKCLNKLSSIDAQFIFDAVGTHCIDVGTHRHGCCVLQRCIDHASGEQKAWLIRQISDNAYTLVQDPFGNYVVQYILDLGEPIFTEPLVAMFKGRVGQLSKQKFSSNVIEKCLRCAQEPSKDMLIEEMLNPTELDRLLRDSFANYVIQTALDYANPAMKARLIDAIRPHLPAIRTTPYGRRIQAKIQGNEGRGVAGSVTQAPEGENNHTPSRQQHVRGNSIVSPNGFAQVYSPVPTISNGLPSRATTQASPFPLGERVVSTQQSQPFPFNSFIRNGAPSGTGNWV